MGVPFEEAMTKRRVFILADRSLFSQGLDSLLRRANTIEVVGITGEEEALDEIKALKPDVVLIRMSRADSGPILSRLLSEVPGVRVVSVNLDENVATIYTSQRFLVTRAEDFVEILGREEVQGSNMLQGKEV